MLENLKFLLKELNEIQYGGNIHQDNIFLSDGRNLKNVICSLESAIEILEKIKKGDD